MVEENKLYLEEDLKLLNQMKELGNSPETSRFDEARLDKEMNILQIKATLRTRKTMDELNKSTNRYSIILIVFAFAQILVALCQLLLSGFTSDHIAIAIGIVVFCILGLVMIFRGMSPDKLLKK